MSFWKENKKGLQQDNPNVNEREKLLESLRKEILSAFKDRFGVSNPFLDRLRVR